MFQTSREAPNSDNWFVTEEDVATFFVSKFKTLFTSLFWTSWDKGRIVSEAVSSVDAGFLIESPSTWIYSWAPLCFRGAILHVRPPKRSFSPLT
uniref:Uncharacterized protein n=1 Tax=Steinernema glaseri TaxID=37863 RepID=A0A1I7Z943_9BILA